MKKDGATSRCLRALFAASCIVWSSCAMEMADEATVDETVVDEAVAGAEADELAASEDEAAEEEALGGAEAAVCLAYGQRCSDSGDCCPDLRCASDGYIKYCRY